MESPEKQVESWGGLSMAKETEFVTCLQDCQWLLLPFAHWQCFTVSFEYAHLM